MLGEDFPLRQGKLPPRRVRAQGVEDGAGMLPRPTRYCRCAAGGDVQTRIRELIKLAKEQGYLTFDDLNEALPERSPIPMRWRSS